MGADGGSIPTRADMVKTKAPASSINRAQQQLELWTHCAISEVPLEAPVVVCGAGRLYNKEAVIRMLLDRTSGGPLEEVARTSFAHLTSLKDVYEAKMDLGARPPFACPVTGKEMNGRFRFYFMPSCGCLLAEQAFKEVHEDGDKTCAGCGFQTLGKPRIQINGPPEKVEAAKKRLIEAKNAGRKQQKEHPKSEPKPISKRLLAEAASKPLPGQILALKRTKAVDSLYQSTT